MENLNPYQSSEPMRGHQTRCFAGKHRKGLNSDFDCSQASSPACTELEMNVMDWLCKALALPSHFLHHHPDSRGGGVLQVNTQYVVALLELSFPNDRCDYYSLMIDVIIIS